VRTTERQSSRASGGFRFLRYTAGSVVALGVSEMALVIAYRSGAFGATGASIVAFFAGAVPNFLLNRSWVWGGRSGNRMRRELTLYAVVSLCSLVAAAAATSWAAHIAPQNADARTMFVAAAYLLTYGVLFLLKFAAYETIVFVAPKPHNDATGVREAAAVVFDTELDRA
jgi:putative flippase GtrA